MSRKSCEVRGCTGTLVTGWFCPSHWYSLSEETRRRLLYASPQKGYWHAIPPQDGLDVMEAMDQSEIIFEHPNDFRYAMEAALKELSLTG